MKKFFRVNLLFIYPIIVLFSCVSIKGPNNFVEYQIPKGAKKSVQITYNGDEINQHHNEEFTYDKKGNLIKVKQIAYIDANTRNKKFIVWETEWKVYGDYVVPYKASCNGTVYSLIEWQVLASSNKGQVKEDVVTRYYHKKVAGLFSSEYQFWNIDLEKYPVPFLSDNKFVKELVYFNFYGKKESKVLTMGYDNIVLKKYYFSYEKLTSGIVKTYPDRSFTNYQLKNISQNSEVDFTFLWEVVADNPCLKKLNFAANLMGKKSNFEVNMNYNYNGKRKREEWIVIEKIFTKMKRIRVFEQILTY